MTAPPRTKSKQRHGKRAMAELIVYTQGFKDLKTTGSSSAMQVSAPGSSAVAQASGDEVKYASKAAKPCAISYTCAR